MAKLMELAHLQDVRFVFSFYLNQWYNFISAKQENMEFIRKKLQIILSF